MISRMIIRGIITLLIIHLSAIENCGITTHIEITHRAASHYEYFLNNKTRISQV